ncbi:MAG: acetate kinase [Bacteroidia bacterium]|nr:acetate kinase [Bacteroidia bacterium]
MQVLVLNSGSSSIKFQLFKMPEQDILCSGIIERIGTKKAKFKFKTSKHKISEKSPILNHKQGLERLANQLLDKETGIIEKPEDITVVGHRVVHGGRHFTDTTIVTDAVKQKIRELSTLAPLHNPPNLEGIEVAEEIFPNAKQVAVFDTAFHQSIPEYAYKYAIPSKYCDDYGIRVYGFHGTSHKYVAKKANTYLGKTKSNVITIHLGNGCSITAVKDGKSIDCSLGFSPISGLIMGTRSGDIDTTIVFHLASKHNIPYEDINVMLQQESGMYGLTGYSDLRDIEEQAALGDKKCQLALDMNAYRIKRFIGSYAAILNGLDAIVFTAGIGENSDVIRRLVCKDLDYLGIELDFEKNNVRAQKLEEINTEDSKVKVLVIPTNEELEIALEAMELINN